MKDIKLLILTVIILFTLSLIDVSAQDDAVRIETNLVTVSVAITDKDGNYITDLKKEDFEVLDGRAKQEIELFSSEDAPVYFSVVYDLEQSEERTRNVLEALRRFAGQLGKKDALSVTVFDERGSLTTDFVPTSAQIAANLENKKANSLYDAILLASQKAEARADAKKVLLVLTDGDDHASRLGLKELRRHLRSVNMPVYTVNFEEKRWNYTDVAYGEQRSLDRWETNELDKAALEEICKTTGGQTFAPAVYNRLYLYTIFTKILTEVENQYVIGFYPETADGKWHKLKVNVNSPQGKKLNASHRKGYQSALAE